MKFEWVRARSEAEAESELARGPIGVVSARTKSIVEGSAQFPDITEDEIAKARAEAMSNCGEGWTTLVPKTIADHYNCKEVHMVQFHHKHDHGGERSCATIQYPEDTTEYAMMSLRLAKRNTLRVTVICDTHDQAEHVSTIIRKICPHHRRAAIDPFFAGSN